MWEQSHRVREPRRRCAAGGWAVSGVHNCVERQSAQLRDGYRRGARRNERGRPAAGASWPRARRSTTSKRITTTAKTSSRVLQHERVRAGQPAAARHLRQRAEERDQRAGQGEDRHRDVEELPASRPGGHAPSVPRRVVQRVQPGELGEPAANASSASFGRITSANAPRIGQIAAKVIW